MQIPQLHLLHITSWLSRNGGGIPPVIWALAREQLRAGSNCHVAGMLDQFVEADCSAKNVPFTAGRIVGPASFGYCPSLRQLRANGAAQPQIVHSHGLWMYSGIAARKTAQKARCPLVISPHGMLEPWALANSSVKKKIAGWLFENRNLRTANCLHALCLPEAKNIRRLGLRNPIAVIPNGVDWDEIHPLPDRDAVSRWVPQTAGKRRILFLSRLHPKKGLENLLRAWARLQDKFPGWILIIAGSGSPNYEFALRKLAVDLGIDATALFLGPVHGDRKRDALAAADIFVLPSFSEGLSMAILEACAAGIPVLHTKECNFPELTKTGAAIEVPTTAPGVEAGLRQLLEISPEQRQSMGRTGMALVRESYTWAKVATQMVALYRWLRNEGPRPEAVLTH